MVIDALDEAGVNGRNELVEMLARNASRLPDWMGIVVTSRPDFDVRTPLQALRPISLDTATESNFNDIRAYVYQRLSSELQNRRVDRRWLGRIPCSRLAHFSINRVASVFERLCEIPIPICVRQ